MDSDQLQKLFRERVGIRIGPHTSDYVAARLLDPQTRNTPLFVMGGDARTGAPVRTQVQPALLLQAQA